MVTSIINVRRIHFKRRTLFFSFNEQNKINAEQCEHGRNKIDRYLWIFFSGFVFVSFVLWFNAKSTNILVESEAPVCINAFFSPFQAFFERKNECHMKTAPEQVKIRLIGISQRCSATFNQDIHTRAHIYKHLPSLFNIHFSFIRSFVCLFVVFIFASQNFVPLHKHTHTHTLHTHRIPLSLFTCFVKTMPLNYGKRQQNQQNKKKRNSIVKIVCMRSLFRKCYKEIFVSSRIQQQSIRPKNSSLFFFVLMQSKK